jgi:integrase
MSSRRKIRRLGPTPVSLLRRAPLEDYLHLERALEAPAAARDERAGLLASLQVAADRGATFDLSILRIPTIELDVRERRALTADELEFFARHVPAIGRRLVLLQGTVGNRIDELLQAEPAHFELDRVVRGVPAPALYVPRNKERRPKYVPLTAEEVELVREQIGGLHVVDSSSSTSACPTTPAGAPRAFMTSGEQRYPTGTVRKTAAGPVPWSKTQYDRLVWQPAVRAAAAAWRLEHELDERADTPFEWYVDPATAPVDGRRNGDDDGRRTLTSHDLRATAVTLMSERGMTRDECAARVGHADAGRLVGAVYDKSDRDERARRGLERVAPQGLRAAAREAAV